MDNLDKKSLDFSRPDVLLFAFQVALIFIVVCVSLFNLTFQWGNVNLWTVILTGSLGYIMPNPKLKTDIEKIAIDKVITQQNI